jgi:hypothetical protein
LFQPRREFMPIQVSSIVELQTSLVARWHERPIENPYDGFWHIVCQQHRFNFELWHQEDIARNPLASDSQIAQVKSAIDRLNQQRNDWIERIDESIGEQLASEGLGQDPSKPLNTETPGSAIDRLSIAALRLFHLEEQLVRADVDDGHRAAVGAKLQICRLQRGDLATSLQELLDDLFTGRKQHRAYRQLKMYNDPALNPEMYNAARRQVA